MKITVFSEKSVNVDQAARWHPETIFFEVIAIGIFGFDFRQYSDSLCLPISSGSVVLPGSYSFGTG
jgi:hypothetical protein